MKIRIKDKLEHVIAFKLADDQLYHINENKWLFHNKKSIFLFDSPIGGFVIFAEHIYINDWNDKFIIADKNLNIILSGQGKGFYYSSNDYLGIQFMLDDEFYDELLSQDDTIIRLGKLNKPNSINLSLKNQFIYLSNNKIISLSLPSAQPLWQFALEELGTFVDRHGREQPHEVVKFLGVWRDRLLVACSQGVILCLDIQTGRELQRFDQCPPYEMGSSIRTRLYDTECFVLDKDHLFALWGYHLWQIDLHRGTITIDYLKADMDDNRIAYYRPSSNYAWDERHIYTVGEVAQHRGGQRIGDRCLLAFNRVTKKVDWQHVFENDSINTDTPQCSGNKLYQLSSSKKLYIFEKETSSPLQTS